jgi:hypothetical protein
LALHEQTGQFEIVPMRALSSISLPTRYPDEHSIRRYIMKTGTTISALIAVALVATPLASFAKGGPGKSQTSSRAQTQVSQKDLARDRLHTRDRVSVPSHDRDRIQDRTHAPDTAKPSNRNSYGNKAMNDQSGNASRQQTQSTSSRQEKTQTEAAKREQLRLDDADAKERTRFEAQHQEQIQTGAKSQGAKPADVTGTE